MRETVFLQTSGPRFAPPRHRARHVVGIAVLAIAAGLVALLVFMAPKAVGPTRMARPRPAAAPALAPRPNYAVQLAPPGRRVKVNFKLPLRSGILFDIHTGRVLWEREPYQRLPIASLTKMMTALMVVMHSHPEDRVLVTPAAAHYSGSGIGLLKQGQRVPLLALLYGLLLPSGNDAAIALSQHVSGTRPRFIARMNFLARRMGLRCSHFNTVSGIVDHGNYSCATDLAVLAHAILEQPLLRKVVSTKTAIVPFPIAGGKLYLYNNNPLMQTGYQGIDGVKTGFTDRAGQCLVASAHRKGVWLGVVLLHSGDPADQGRQLLDAGFAAVGK